MAKVTLPVPENVERRRFLSLPEPLVRVAQYTVYRTLALFFTVVVGVYLTILIANMGGYVDQIRIAQVREAAGARVLTDPQLQRLPPARSGSGSNSRCSWRSSAWGWTAPL